MNGNELEYIKGYGWIVVMLIILLRETFPMIWKSLTKKQTVEDAERRRKDQLELEHHQKLENRQVAAFERIADNTDQTRSLIQSLQTFLVGVDGRLTRIEEQNARTSETLAILLDRAEKLPSPRRPRGYDPGKPS